MRTKATYGMHSDYLRHNLPKLPARAELARLLRSLNEAFAHPSCGPEYVSLYCDGAGWPDAHWTVGCDAGDWPSAGNECSRERFQMTPTFQPTPPIKRTHERFMVVNLTTIWYWLADFRE